MIYLCTSVITTSQNCIIAFEAHNFECYIIFVIVSIIVALTCTVYVSCCHYYDCITVLIYSRTVILQQY